MDTIQYKCPNCGGPLEYKADRQKFACDYCQSEYTDREVKQLFQSNENIDLSQNIDESSDEFTSGNLYICDNCGAEIMADTETAATFCIYCHSPVMLKGRLSGEYRPKSVIPFKLGKEEALKIFKDTMGKKKFLPSDFLTQNTLDKMTGLYVPFWLADCKTDTSMNATGKKIRSWTSGSYSYTETKEYAVVRAASLSFEGVPADGASKIDDDLMDALEPFDYSEMKPFSMSYLSGFLADRYDVDKAGVFPRIREKVDTAGRSMIDESIQGYDSVIVSNFSSNIMKTDWNYALLPVWFMTYRYNGKLYEFAVNGQSGKMAGIPPLSVRKLFLFGLGLFILLAVIFGFGGNILL